jgi:hypothetical protein
MVDLAAAGEMFTLVGIIAAAVIFSRLALKGKSLGSFRFQLSIFILIWVAAELPHVAATLGYISDTDYATFGLFIHMISMAAFAAFVGVKSLDYFKQAPLPPSASMAPAISTSPSERPER